MMGLTPLQIKAVKYRRPLNKEKTHTGFTSVEMFLSHTHTHKHPGGVDLPRLEHRLAGNLYRVQERPLP